MENRWAWMRQSACKDSDPKLFDNDTDAQSPPYEAKRICDGCQVRAECLSLHIYDYHGIWGGTTNTQRVALRSEHTRTSCPACIGQLIIAQEDTEVCLSCGISWISNVKMVKL
jgi:hypothetical protein